MCDIIFCKNGKEIETCREFEEHFDEIAKKWIDRHYSDDIELDACLCQINLDQFMKSQPFEYDCGAWHEK